MGWCSSKVKIISAVVLAALLISGLIYFLSKSEPVKQEVPFCCVNSLTCKNETKGGEIAGTTINPKWDINLRFKVKLVNESSEGMNTIAEFGISTVSELL